MKKKLSTVTLSSAVTKAAIWPRRTATNMTASTYRTPRPVTGATSSSKATTPVAAPTAPITSSAAIPIWRAPPRCPFWRAIPADSAAVLRRRVAALAGDRSPALARRWRHDAGDLRPDRAALPAGLSERGRDRWLRRAPLGRPLGPRGGERRAFRQRPLLQRGL